MSEDQELYDHTHQAIRIPDVEDAVLGCLLMDASLLASCDLTDEDFTSPDKRRIYGIMRRLGPDADLATVGTIVRREVQGVDLGYLAVLMESVPTSKLFGTYCRQLRTLKGAGATCGGKPVILIPGQHHVAGGELCIGTDHFADRVLAMIPDGTLYRRGNDVGLIVGAPGERRFDPLTSDATRRLIDANVTLFTSRNKPSDADPAPAPDANVTPATGDALRFVASTRDLGGLVADAARSHRKCRDLVMLTPFPVYRPDWSLSPPGYHDGIYYDEPPGLAGLQPRDDWELLLDLIQDFPFRDEASRCNVVGLMLTPLIRHAVGNVPFHLIHASMERTGKTKLVDAISIVVTGQESPAIQVSEREEETEKRITSAMRAGKPILFFDNLRDFLDSASLAALATAKVWEGRVLGRSELATFPNRSTVVMTGNNVRTTGELVKRTMPILLQAKTDAPEDRQDFVHPDLPAWVRFHRVRIVGALLGLVERWKDAGRPSGRVRLGGFEEWAAAVGGMLEGTAWARNAAEWRRGADPAAEDLALLVQAWEASRGGLECQASVIADIAKSAGLFPHVFAKDGPGAVMSFARRVLMPAVDRPVGSWKIIRTTSGSSGFWRLVPLQ